MNGRVVVEVGSRTVIVDAVELRGVDRDAAWAAIRSARPRADDAGAPGVPERRSRS